MVMRFISMADRHLPLCNLFNVDLLRGVSLWLLLESTHSLKSPDCVIVSDSQKVLHSKALSKFQL